MKIGVVGEDEMISELQTTLKASGEIEWLRCKNVNELLQHANMDAYFDLDFNPDPDRIAGLSTLLPKPVFINEVVNTLAQIDRPFVRLNAWPTFLKRTIVELAVYRDESFALVKIFMDSISWQYQVVPDKPGMVSPRIVSMIINEAFYALEENVSSREDIDLAMKLGTNYPYGPFEWSQKIGLENILQLLQTLEKMDERYTISSLLKNEASGKKNKSKKSF